MIAGWEMHERLLPMNDGPLRALDRLADVIVAQIDRDPQVEAAEAELRDRLASSDGGRPVDRALLDFITLEYRGILVAATTRAVLIALQLADEGPRAGATLAAVPSRRR
jgi:hypothetical protein